MLVQRLFIKNEAEGEKIGCDVEKEEEEVEEEEEQENHGQDKTAIHLI